MSTQRIGDIEIVPATVTDIGRDGMNLLEFPLATLADRAPKGCKTLEFEDRIWDRGRREWITRRLTVSASDKYGLPTALDDEVILGLIQLTKANEFQNRRVFFSRYRLIQKLGWRDEGKSYTRLETSLKRWLGVTLSYDNAWWDKRHEQWVDEHFHLLDHVVLHGKTRGRNRRTELALSSFTWNEVVFDSFQAGYIKRLDMGVYRSLRLATSKRIYRFLDKRFHQSSRWTFDLFQFAQEHIGLSRCYDTAQLKRRLKPAIRELEDIGFLVPMETSDRYRRICRGQWKIAFLRAKPRDVLATRTTVHSPIERRLIERGVKDHIAVRLAREYPDTLIQAKLDDFDILQSRNDSRISKNPPGYLVQSIRNDYQLSTSPKPPTVKRPPKRKAIRKPRRPREDRRVEEYLKSLPRAEHQQLEQQAMASAPPLLAKGLQRAEESDNAEVLQTYRKVILETYVTMFLDGKGE